MPLMPYKKLNLNLLIPVEYRWMAWQPWGEPRVFYLKPKIKNISGYCGDEGLYLDSVDIYYHGRCWMDQQSDYNDSDGIGLGNPIIDSDLLFRSHTFYKEQMGKMWQYSLRKL